MNNDHLYLQQYLKLIDLNNIQRSMQFQNLLQYAKNINAINQYLKSYNISKKVSQKINLNSGNLYSYISQTGEQIYYIILKDIQISIDSCNFINYTLIVSQVANTIQYSMMSKEYMNFVLNKSTLIMSYKSIADLFNSKKILFQQNMNIINVDDITNNIIYQDWIYKLTNKEQIVNNLIKCLKYWEIIKISNISYNINSQNILYKSLRIFGDNNIVDQRYTFPILTFDGIIYDYKQKKNIKSKYIYNLTQGTLLSINAFDVMEYNECKEEYLDEEVTKFNIIIPKISEDDINKMINNQNELIQQNIIDLNKIENQIENEKYLNFINSNNVQKMLICICNMVHIVKIISIQYQFWKKNGIYHVNNKNEIYSYNIIPLCILTVNTEWAKNEKFYFCCVQNIEKNVLTFSVFPTALSQMNLSNKISNIQFNLDPLNIENINKYISTNK